GRLRVFYGERLVADLSMDFLHEGLPRRHLQAVWTPPTVTEPDRPEPADLGAVLLQMLAHPNIRSRADILHRYDHEVQGGTAVKPLVGRDPLGPGDAAVLIPQPLVEASLPGPSSWPGVALAVGINPRYGLIDPYAMAWACVDEAFRNAVAVGADPDRVALLDNFCWGNPNLPDRLGSLVRCAQGCHDAALAYEAPFISGKDSLNNEYTDASGRRLAIPGTLLISALGIVPDGRQMATTDLKAPGDVLYLLGETRAELGGSVYDDLHGLTGASVPQPYAQPLARLRSLHRALRSGLVRACHDLSEGGLAVALAEMVIGGGLGVTVDLAAVPTAEPLTLSQLLFAESLGRFLIEVAPEHTAAFETMLAGQPLGRIGVVTAVPRLTIRDGAGRVCLDLTLADLTRAFAG
ncbi:MAG: AIR synthase-related protein, partial [Anaerolineae bacterium]|nr:AIR synthase-related protein [Anaerolineae bacterium]